MSIPNRYLGNIQISRYWRENPPPEKDWRSIFKIPQIQDEIQGTQHRCVRIDFIEPINTSDFMAYRIRSYRVSLCFLTPLTMEEHSLLIGKAKSFTLLEKQEAAVIFDLEDAPEYDPLLI